MNDAYSRKWLILAAVTLVSFITNVDGTIVVVGLPRLMESLHMTVVTGLWTITSYLITSTVFLLPAGKWSDSIGTKRIFLFGLAIFTVATALCGVANSGATLILFRFIQGTGAALSLATATPIIVRSFPTSELGRAIGINSISWVIGAIVGPVVGGSLISSFGWRSIFFVTVPFALVGMVMAWIVLKRGQEQVRTKTDWGGILTFGLGLISLLVALSEGQSWGWASKGILGLFLGALILSILFVLLEIRVKHPLFNLRTLKHRPYAFGLAITLFYCIGFFAVTFLLTLYLQGALGLGPLAASLLLVPLSVPQLFMSPLGGTLADKFGSSRLVIIGLVFLAISSLLLGNLGTQLSISAIVIPLLIMSAANGLAWPALSKAVLASAPLEQMGSASGMFYTFRNIGMSLSQTLGLVIAERSVPPAIASQAFLGTMGLQNTQIQSALVHATDTSFRFFAVFFVIAMLLGLFLLNSKRKSHVQAAQTQEV